MNREKERREAIKESHKKKARRDIEDARVGDIVSVQRLVKSKISKVSLVEPLKKYEYEYDYEWM